MLVAMVCPGCGTTFQRRHDRPGYCSRSCYASSRRGAANSNWRKGKFDHPLYPSYTQMVYRCTRPEHPRYADYGGRGITVSARWLGHDGFWNFVSDMGERPEGMSLDRVDNDGLYSPDNCRWATDIEQNNNRRTPRKVS